MINSQLKEIENIRKEKKYLEDKIRKIEEKPIKKVQDSVYESSKRFPYTKHIVKIEGFEFSKNKLKYKKLLKREKYKLEKAITNLEYEIQKIKDSEIRQIIRYRYEEGKSWIQIMYLMDYESEEAPRKKLERFLKKL